MKQKILCEICEKTIKSKERFKGDYDCINASVIGGFCYWGFNRNNWA